MSKQLTLSATFAILAMSVFALSAGLGTAVSDPSRTAGVVKPAIVIGR